MSSLSSTGDTTSNNMEGRANSEPAVEQGVCDPPTTSQSYVYPGYDGTYPKVNGQGCSPHSIENTCCMPSYIPYSPGQVMAIEGHTRDQQTYVSQKRNLQHTISYGSETMPVYSRDSKPRPGDWQTGCDDSNTNASCSRAAEGPDSVKRGLTSVAKPFSKKVDTNPHQPVSLSNFPGRPIQPLNRAHHLSSGSESSGVAKGHHHPARSSNQPHTGFFPRNNPVRSMPIFPTVNNNDRFQIRGKFNIPRSYGASSELVCGPRAGKVKNPLSSSAEKNDLNHPFLTRDQFNKPDFEVKYDKAKFFMIKSYSEDDVHKSIKYSVWSSTINGNNKLEAAYQNAEAEKNEKRTKCPVFLFFSVNASGQFVGLAEMVGPVDFKKTMDFWQQDKWSGFFPVKWHIVKDIPNRQFQHITLENNDNKAVTFSRDTQEIRLPQGLRMLQIFKAYQAGTSILDDFDFYEERQTSLSTARRIQQAPTTSELDFLCDNSVNHVEGAFRQMRVSANPREPPFAAEYSQTNFHRRSIYNHRPANRS